MYWTLLEGIHLRIIKNSLQWISECFLHIFYENGERKSGELWWIDVNKAKSTTLLSIAENIKLTINIPNIPFIQTILI